MSEFSYRIDGRGIIIRNEDNVMIPKEPKNITYQMYLDWRAAGNIPPVEPPLEDDLFARSYGITMEKIEK